MRTAIDSAAAALRRAGRNPGDPALIRMVIRGWRDAGEIPTTDMEWWDRLVREMPLGARRHRTIQKREWQVSS